MAGTRAATAYLIDASVYVFRAYYSIPDHMHNDAGQPVNAVYGFADFLARFLGKAKPKHVCFAFDESLSSSFRNEVYPPYKANRETAPEELMRQFSYCRELVRLMGLPACSSPRFEADDLIADLAQRLRKHDFKIIVVSTDKDLAQVLRPGDQYWDFARNKRRSHSQIKEWLGVESHQVADLLALTGDTVDNLPGIPGVGPKTAAALLARFGNLDTIYAKLADVAQTNIRGAKQLRGKLEDYRKQVEMVRSLTQLSIQTDLADDIRDLAREKVDMLALHQLMTALGFGNGIKQRLEQAVKT